MAQCAREIAASAPLFEGGAQNVRGQVLGRPVSDLAVLLFYDCLQDVHGKR